MNIKKLSVGYVVASAKNWMLAITVGLIAFGCNKPGIDPKDLKNFQVVNLVANKAIYHPVNPLDPTLQNAFGIAWSPNGTAWVNSVGGHVSELYSSEGVIARKPVNIPSPTDIVGGLPCGIVFSGGKGFNQGNGLSSFIFTGFDGVLSAWNGASGDNAKRLKVPPGAGYTGLAIAKSGDKDFIYGANFLANKIDVWDTTFTKITMTFKDPSMPAGYSPYNIQAVGDWLFVMYAELVNGFHGNPGQGRGFVSVFNPDGSFVKRFASRGSLNIPWGATLAPASFLEDQDVNNLSSEGEADFHHGHGNDDPKNPVVLIGNFGDGRINVYSLEGNFIGQLKSHQHPIEVEGLWALSFAPTTSTVDQKRLYFSAGPANEADGVFGYLIKQ